MPHAFLQVGDCVVGVERDVDAKMFLGEDVRAALAHLGLNLPFGFDNLVGVGPIEEVEGEVHGNWRFLPHIVAFGAVCYRQLLLEIFPIV